MTLSTIVGFALFLLPIIGIEGAALGVAIGYLVSILMMIFFTFRIFGWNLITNRVAIGIKKNKIK
jgi:Na+-driven multidrug efflux pump